MESTIDTSHREVTIQDNNKESVIIKEEDLKNYVNMLASLPQFKDIEKIDELFRYILEEFYINIPKEIEGYFKGLAFDSYKFMDPLYDSFFQERGIDIETYNISPDIKRKLLFQLGRLYQYKGSNEVFDILAFLLKEYINEIKFYNIEVVQVGEILQEQKIKINKETNSFRNHLGELKRIRDGVMEEGLYFIDDDGYTYDILHGDPQNGEDESDLFLLLGLGTKKLEYRLRPLKTTKDEDYLELRDSELAYRNISLNEINSPKFIMALKQFVNRDRDNKYNEVKIYPILTNIVHAEIVSQMDKIEKYENHIDLIRLYGFTKLQDTTFNINIYDYETSISFLDLMLLINYIRQTAFSYDRWFNLGNTLQSYIRSEEEIPDIMEFMDRYKNLDYSNRDEFQQYVQDFNQFMNNPLKIFNYNSTNNIGTYLKGQMSYINSIDEMLTLIDNQFSNLYSADEKEQLLGDIQNLIIYKNITTVDQLIIELHTNYPEEMNIIINISNTLDKYPRLMAIISNKLNGTEDEKYFTSVELYRQIYGSINVDIIDPLTKKFIDDFFTRLFLGTEFLNSFTKPLIDLFNEYFFKIETTFKQFNNDGITLKDKMNSIAFDDKVHFYSIASNRSYFDLKDEWCITINETEIFGDCNNDDDTFGESDCNPTQMKLAVSFKEEQSILEGDTGTFTCELTNMYTNNPWGFDEPGVLRSVKLYIILEGWNPDPIEDNDVLDLKYELTFLPGEWQKDFSIKTINDGIIQEDGSIEQTEYFRINVEKVQEFVELDVIPPTLYNEDILGLNEYLTLPDPEPTGYVNIFPITSNIYQNDPEPAPSFTPKVIFTPSQDIFEGNQATFTALLVNQEDNQPYGSTDPSTTRDVEVDIILVPLSENGYNPVEQEDFVDSEINFSLYFPEGTRGTTFTVSTLNDLFYNEDGTLEDTEWFQIQGVELRENMQIKSMTSLNYNPMDLPIGDSIYNPMANLNNNESGYAAYEPLDNNIYQDQPTELYINYSTPTELKEDEFSTNPVVFTLYNYAAGIVGSSVYHSESITFDLIIEQTSDDTLENTQQEDYSNPNFPKTIQVTIPAFSQANSIAIDIFEDLLLEEDEYFQIRIDNMESAEEANVTVLEYNQEPTIIKVIDSTQIVASFFIDNIPNKTYIPNGDNVMVEGKMQEGTEIDLNVKIINVNESTMTNPSTYTEFPLDEGEDLHVQMELGFEGPTLITYTLKSLYLAGSNDYHQFNKWNKLTEPEDVMTNLNDTTHIGIKDFYTEFEAGNQADVVSINTTMSNSVFIIKTDEFLYGIGNNDLGQLGLVGQEETNGVSGENFVYQFGKCSNVPMDSIVGCSERCAVAKSLDGKYYAAGDITNIGPYSLDPESFQQNSFNELFHYSSLGIKELFIGLQNAFYIGNDNKLYVTGDNANYQFASDSMTSSSEFHQVILGSNDDVTKFRTNSNACIAWTTSTLYAWGLQLGSMPIEIGSSPDIYLFGQPSSNNDAQEQNPIDILNFLQNGNYILSLDDARSILDKSYFQLDKVVEVFILSSGLHFVIQDPTEINTYDGSPMCRLFRLYYLILDNEAHFEEIPLYDLIPKNAKMSASKDNFGYVTVDEEKKLFMYGRNDESSGGVNGRLGLNHTEMWTYHKNNSVLKTLTWTGVKNVQELSIGNTNTAIIIDEDGVAEENKMPKVKDILYGIGENSKYEVSPTLAQSVTDYKPILPTRIKDFIPANNIKGQVPSTAIRDNQDLYIWGPAWSTSTPTDNGGYPRIIASGVVNYDANAGHIIYSNEKNHIYGLGYNVTNKQISSIATNIHSPIKIEKHLDSIGLAVDKVVCTEKNTMYLSAGDIYFNGGQISGTGIDAGTSPVYQKLTSSMYGGSTYSSQIKDFWANENVVFALTESNDLLSLGYNGSKKFCKLGDPTANDNLYINQFEPIDSIIDTDGNTLDLSIEEIKDIKIKLFSIFILTYNTQSNNHCLYVFGKNIKGELGLVPGLSSNSYYISGLTKINQNQFPDIIDVQPFIHSTSDVSSNYNSSIISYIEGGIVKRAVAGSSGSEKYRWTNTGTLSYANQIVDTGFQTIPNPLVTNSSTGEKEELQGILNIYMGEYSHFFLANEISIASTNIYKADLNDMLINDGNEFISSGLDESSFGDSPGHPLSSLTVIKNNFAKNDEKFYFSTIIGPNKTFNLKIVDDGSAEGLTDQCEVVTLRVIGIVDNNGINTNNKGPTFIGSSNDTIESHPQVHNKISQWLFDNINKYSIEICDNPVPE